MQLYHKSYQRVFTGKNKLQNLHMKLGSKLKTLSKQSELHHLNPYSLLWVFRLKSHSHHCQNLILTHISIQVLERHFPQENTPTRKERKGLLQVKSFSHVTFQNLNTGRESIPEPLIISRLWLQLIVETSAVRRYSKQEFFSSYQMTNKLNFKIFTVDLFIKVTDF